MTKYVHTECPYCSHSVEVDVKFAAKNGRIFCTTCCKAFNVLIKDDETKSEEPSPVPEVKQEVVEEKEKPPAEKFPEDKNNKDKQEIPDSWFWI